MKDLLIVNFTMDQKNSLLSHQIDAVERLAPNFRQVVVLTANSGDYSPHGNIKIFSTSWVSGKPFRNVWKLYKNFFEIIRSENIDVIFSHMTDLQSALLLPITKILRIKHFLWYAHKHKSKYLLISNYFLDGIVTSTLGSCPIKGRKVISVGQGVDSAKFEFVDHSLNTHLRLLHVGRFDSSKRIEEIVELALELRDSNLKVSLALIGDPSNENARKYSELIIDKYKNQLDADWLNFFPSVTRAVLPEMLKKYDVFVHAYLGSLDKTLIESTLSGLPVVSTNPEYLKIFGPWREDDSITLLSEFLALRSLSSVELSQELLRRRRICVEHHSLSNWINQITEVLYS